MAGCGGYGQGKVYVHPEHTSPQAGGGPDQSRPGRPRTGRAATTGHARALPNFHHDLRITSRVPDNGRWPRESTASQGSVLGRLVSPLVSQLVRQHRTGFLRLAGGVCRRFHRSPIGGPRLRQSLNTEAIERLEELEQERAP
jgi:hypothetical protein